MFTAVVLTHSSHEQARALANALGLQGAGCKVFCHHVTLAMGDASNRFKVGEPRSMMLTHFGTLTTDDGSVSAFKVSGASDSDNATPHLTIATSGAAKPKHSNAIRDWVALRVPVEIVGVVTVCE